MVQQIDSLTDLNVQLGENLKTNDRAFKLQLKQKDSFIREFENQLVSLKEELKQS